MAVSAALGESAWPTLLPLLEDYRIAAKSQSVTMALLVLDDAASMAEFGFDPLFTTQPDAIREVVRRLARSLDLRAESTEVLLIGGDAILPMFRLPNPVSDRTLDPDSLVLSDNPYGSIEDTLDALLAPRLPVGRICDGGSVDSFTAALRGAAENYRRGAAGGDSFAVINEEWITVSQGALGSMVQPLDLRQAPFYRISTTNAVDLQHRYLYFNLHGFDGDPAWRSYDIARDQFLEVVTPDVFTAANIAGSLIVSEACYGAQVAGRTPDNSCALRIQREGATLIGATGLVFGSLLQPWLTQVDNADKLAGFLFSRARSGIATAGQLLVDGRREFVRFCGGASINVFEQKTALQFILFGDPSLPVTP